MTPKEKAYKIYSDMLYHIEFDFGDNNRHSNGVAKACAYNAVAEILESEPLSPTTCPVGSIGENKTNTQRFWHAVLREINEI